jgi:hypothetical protein
MVIAGEPIRYVRPFDETIFLNSPWFVALGDPGSGKSTAIKKLILDYTESAQDLTRILFSGIPIYIPLRDYARERQANGQGYSLLDFIYANAKGSLNARCSTGFFEHYLDEGECLVCFDGLDEVVATGQRQEISSIVESFVYRYPRNRYVVTSRIVGYGQAPLSDRIFPHYTVQPFRDEDVEKYIQRWYQHHEKSKLQAEKLSKELFGAIRSNPNLRDLAQHPLLLAIIALVHRSEAEIPILRSRLYDKCADALLSTFEAVKRLSRTDTEKHFFKYRRELLESVAYWMQTDSSSSNNRDVVVSKAQLHHFLTKKLQDDPSYELSRIEARQQATDFLRFIEERTGLLVEKGEEQYSFVHLTFQEYFAACYIHYHFDDDLQLFDEVLRHLTDSGWREVLLLLMGKSSEFKNRPNRIIEKILKNPPDDEQILKRGLSFASSCMLDNVWFENSTQKRIINGWIDVVRHPICLQQEQMAIETIKRLMKTEFTSTLIEQAGLNEYETIQTRLTLLSLFGDMRDIKLAPPWVETAILKIIEDRGFNPSIRYRALQIALFAIPINKLVPIVISLFHSDPVGPTLCFYWFRESGMDDMMRLPRGSVFARWMVYLFPELSEYVSDEEYLIQVLPSRLVDKFKALIAQEPLYAIALAKAGWNHAWSELFAVLRDPNQPVETVQRLMRYSGDFIVPNLEKDRSQLIEVFKEISLRRELGLAGVDGIHWLRSLHCSPADLFNLVMHFDTLYDRDDWNVEVMSGFFEGIIRQARMNNGANDEPGDKMIFLTSMNKIDKEQHLSLEASYLKKVLESERDLVAWMEAIVKNQHFTLQLSFFKGLLKIDHDLAKRLVQALYQQSVETNIADRAGYITLALIDKRGMSDEEIRAILIPRLEQFKDNWVKALCAYNLYKIDSIEKGKLHDIFLEIGQNERKNTRLKQDIAAFLATDLDEREIGLNLLREILLDSNGHEEAKDEAYSSLQKIVDPNNANLKKLLAYVDVDTIPVQNWITHPGEMDSFTR